MKLSKLSTLAALVTFVTIAVSIFSPIGLDSSAQATQDTVPLGSTATFAILAGTSITNTGDTIVNGNLGVSPGATVDGFSPGIVTGTQHKADDVAAQAQIDLTPAYDNAAVRLADTVDTELGGTTKYTGVYETDAGTLEITGDLTLDAQGDPDAVFIFQAGSTLTTADGSRVILINNAQAANVFWQVTSSATLGADSVFQGNILALTSITVGNSATVTGRLLARNGTVSLDANTVTLPPPTVTAIQPVSGPATGGTAVTITGTNFITGATVTIGGAPATSVIWVSSTSITATTPAGTAGAKDLVVTNPDTQIGTLTGGFTYVAPTFTLIAPTGIELLGTAETFSEGINTGFSAHSGVGCNQWGGLDAHRVRYQNKHERPHDNRWHG